MIFYCILKRNTSYYPKGTLIAVALHSKVYWALSNKYKLIPLTYAWHSQRAFIKAWATIEIDKALLNTKLLKLYLQG
jgi:hypothetical protein